MTSVDQIGASGSYDCDNMEMGRILYDYLSCRIAGNTKTVV